MGSTDKVLSRMRQNVADLSQHFSECLDYFDTVEPFVGPSSYFHHKALVTRLSYDSITSLLQDELFFDWLYATLTAWGLHRMGPGNAKLRDIKELKASLRQQAAILERLSPRAITTLTPQDARQTTRQVWSVLSALKVSIAEARIVANSKALHHVLPRLVPPIDREYTFNFFYGRNNLTITEEEAFFEIYRELHHIAVNNTQEITSRIGKDWHTSETKVIDNAIVGYMLKKRRSVLV